MRDKIRKYIKKRIIIKRISKYFDISYYTSTYPNAKSSDLSPVEHYLMVGWRQGYDPTPWFSTRFYLDNNPDVASSGINPFYHYIMWGNLEGRRPNDVFLNSISPSHAESKPSVDSVNHSVSEAHAQTSRLSHYFQLYEYWLSEYGISINDCSPPNELFKNPLVVIIGDLNLPQCKKYRVIQKMELFSDVGIQSDYSHWMDEPRAINLLQMASIVIFYRLPNNEKTKFLFREARRLGIPIIFDIDDPIFDRETYEKNLNLNFLEEAERRHLLAQCDGYVSFLRESDIISVSTPVMKDLVEQYVNVPVIIWRNALDREVQHIAKRINSRTTHQEDNHGIVIGYMSGSRAHEADFRIIENVLLEIFKNFKQVKLKIVGYLSLPDSFIPYKERISQIPFSDYEEYLWELSGVDICVIPLTIDKFNDCKSAIRYLEASIVKVPTIVSKVGDFMNIIHAPYDGILVSDNEEWLDALNGLITNRERRKEMALMAYRNVMGDQLVISRVNSLKNILNQLNISWELLA